MRLGLRPVDLRVGGGQGEGEGGALALFAFHSDGATVALDKAINAGESEAGS